MLKMPVLLRVVLNDFEWFALAGAGEYAEFDEACLAQAQIDTPAIC
jgi:hypothetical protein